MTFPGRILFLGCGSVTQCSLPLLLREQVCPPDRITVLDMVDNRARIAAEITQGVTYVVDRITPDNLAEVLARYVGPGDICLDLAWNIDTCTILQWCRDNGVRYLNTSVEVWDPYDDAAHVPPLDRTLYVRHMAMRRMLARWGDNRGPSAVVEHGANPGLVSHWTKQALVEIGESALRDGLVPALASARLETALADGAFPAIAQRSRSTSSSTPGRSRGSTRRAWRRPRWAGAPTSAACRPTPTCTPARARPTRSAWPAWAPRRGCARVCRPARSWAW
jgi:homospermidine synthase